MQLFFQLQTALFPFRYPQQYSHWTKMQNFEKGTLQKPFREDEKLPGKLLRGGASSGQYSCTKVYDCKSCCVLLWLCTLRSIILLILFIWHYLTISVPKHEKHLALSNQLQTVQTFSKWARTGQESSLFTILLIWHHLTVLIQNTKNIWL